MWPHWPGCMVLVFLWLMGIQFQSMFLRLKILDNCKRSSSCCQLESYWDRSAFETDSDLPAGWMRVRDTSGTYYWHIPTGTTQWEPPSPMEEGAVPERPSSTSPALTPSEEPQVFTAPNSFLIYRNMLELYFYDHLRSRPAGQSRLHILKCHFVCVCVFCLFCFLDYLEWHRSSKSI